MAPKEVNMIKVDFSHPDKILEDFKKALWLKNQFWNMWFKKMLLDCVLVIVIHSGGSVILKDYFSDCRIGNLLWIGGVINRRNIKEF